ncbi:MAG: hypothetical protein ACI9Y1_000856 [Lentisphaeria bacterium]|jgi:hypothetical protein
MQQYCESCGFLLANFNFYTPIGLTLTLTVLEYQRLGMQADAGAERFFTVKAA